MLWFLGFYFSTLIDASIFLLVSFVLLMVNNDNLLKDRKNRYLINLEKACVVFLIGQDLHLNEFKRRQL